MRVLMRGLLIHMTSRFQNHAQCTEDPPKGFPGHLFSVDIEVGGGSRKIVAGETIIHSATQHSGVFWTEYSQFLSLSY